MTEEEALDIIKKHGYTTAKRFDAEDAAQNKEIDDILYDRPFLGFTLGLDAETIKRKGFSYAFELLPAKEQEEISEDIFKNLGEYVDWKVKQASDGVNYIDVKFKPEFWMKNDIEKIKGVLVSIDRGFMRYGA